MLDRFPLEVLSLVLRQVREKADLKNLSEVSKLLRQCTVPELYRSITFFASDEQSLLELGVDSFLNRNSSYLKYVKELHFAAYFHRQLRTRCPMDDEVEIDDDDDKRAETAYDNEWGSNLVWPSRSAHRKSFHALESRLIPLFSHIRDNSLEKFSWNLGTCVPEAVLNFLSEKQPSIRSLSITTDVTCMLANDRENIYDSFRFTQLQKISWRTPTSQKLQVLGEILRGSAHMLEEVEIDYIDIFDLDPIIYQENYLVGRYLRLKPGEQCVLFSSLRKLSLSGISFMYGINDILYAFNLSQLRSLKLRDCLDTDPLLDALASSSQALRLTSFEFNFTGHCINEEDLMPLARFLQSFKGLESLYILFPKHGDLSEEYWHAITHHMLTLERVVHHEVEVYLNPEYIQSGDGHIGALLMRASLKCLGICCLPSNLTSFFSQLNPRPKIRLLHIRVTGYVTFESIQHNVNERADPEFLEALPEVLNFADWAFGPDGLPELEILAYGDFSFQGRQPNVLLCRSQDLMENMTDQSQDTEVAGASNGLYRQVLKEDFRSWEMVQEHSDFLEACAEDYLLHK